MIAIRNFVRPKRLAAVLGLLCVLQSFASADDRFVFPATGDARVIAVPPNLWNAGDRIDGIRTFSTAFNSLTMTLQVDTNVLSCDTQDHDVQIDGVTIGSFRIAAGQTVVSACFNFPAFAAGTHTITLLTTRTVAGGCGSAGFLDNVSFFSFAPDTFVYPATGDPRVIAVPPNLWNRGDHIDGVRNFALPFSNLDIDLDVITNVLSCDTQDHDVQIDGVTIGSFRIGAGQTNVRASFKFPTIPAGIHTITLLTTRTVNGGCGSAGFSDDISKFDFGGGCPGAASLVTDNPGGTNPVSYTVRGSHGGAPVSGGTVSLFVDVTGTTGHRSSTVLGYLAGRTTVLGGGQVLLMDVANPNGEILKIPLQLGNTALRALPVPNDAAICGLSLFTQGLHVGGVRPFALSNRNILTVGF